MSRVIRPIEYNEIPDWKIPIFECWPIKWTWDWQKKVRDLIDNRLWKEYINNVVYIDPRRISYQKEDWKKLFTPWFEKKHNWRQRWWELEHLDICKNSWIILFWCAKQTESILNSVNWMQSKAYWSTTREELGFMMWKWLDNVFVWFDEWFPESKTSKLWLDYYAWWNFDVYNNLDTLTSVVVSRIIDLSKNKLEN